MFRVPDETVRRFDAAMDAARIGMQERGYYQKWLRYYLDFCDKYRLPSVEAGSLAPFLEKLASKNQSDVQRQQASRALRLYLDMRRVPKQEAAPAEESRCLVAPPPLQVAGLSSTANGVSGKESVVQPKPGMPAQPGNERPLAVREAPLPDPSPVVAVSSGAAPQGTRSSAPSSSRRDETPTGSPTVSGASCADSLSPTGASWVKELESLRNTIRLRNYSPRTSETYLHWTRKFQTYTHSKPPGELGTEDVKAFLTDLAVRQNVAASTQNQAFNALLFFFRHVLGREFGKVEGVVRAKRRRYIPVVLSREEVDRVVAQLAHPYNLVVLILYGCGLRISEALELRIQCFNLDEGILTVHDGKGQKDRTVPLPKMLLPGIRAQFERVAALRREDLAQGSAGVFLPRQLDKKYPNAGREFVWQWFFPAKQLSFVESKGEYRRYHMLDSDVQRAVKAAADAAGIPKRVTPHTFRHTFASHLLQANVDIRTIQERLGHSDVRTTMIYTHTVPSRTLKDVGSPLDFSANAHERVAPE